MKLVSLFLLFLFLSLPAVAEQNTEQEQSRQVDFYPTYAYLDGEVWVIPMRVYIHRSRRIWERITTRMARNRFNLDSDEAANFRDRISGFVTNSRSRREVVFTFDDDPREEVYGIIGSDGLYQTTDNFGYAQGFVRIHKDRAKELLEAQKSENGWLSFRTESDRYYGEGKIELIEPEGLSIVSDIDDTIKVTEIPAGSRVVVRNTFFKDYTAAPGMNQKYHQYENASFHYVSGSPWQLFQPLHGFLIEEEGFPPGSFHMKTVRKNIFRLGSWSDLRELATDEKVTFNQKISQISEIVSRFPKREFILIGDSGERDPEVYNEIRNRFPDQIKEIIIRDVVNHRQIEPERLDGMNIIRARTVVEGQSQFQ